MGEYEDRINCYVILLTTKTLLYATQKRGLIAIQLYVHINVGVDHRVLIGGCTTHCRLSHPQNRGR